MLLVTVQALGELAVLFPVNGAFFTYVVRFVDPSLYVLPLVLVLVELIENYSGFAVGWDYAIGWLTVLPFELTAAGITIKFWNANINIGVRMISIYFQEALPSSQHNTNHSPLFKFFGNANSFVFLGLDLNIPSTPLHNTDIWCPGIW
jgi:hypothetical protein